MSGVWPGGLRQGSLPWPERWCLAACTDGLTGQCMATTSTKLPLSVPECHAWVLLHQSHLCSHLCSLLQHTPEATACSVPYLVLEVGDKAVGVKGESLRSASVVLREAA